MSNASNLSTLANVLDDGSDGQFLKSTGSGGVAFDTVAAGAVVYATADLLPLSGNSAGDMAYVTATNRFYINNGSGWYSVSLVNTNPNITSVQDAGSNTTPFTLATDGTATVITVTAADPEDVPLTYGYSVTSGSLNGSTVAQGTGSNTNVFTVTPHASQDATFTLTFTASDGINQATSANAFSLSFVTTVTDSKYTSLLATATSTGGNSTITDSSTANSGNPHNIVVNNDVTASTFSPYRSGGYSTYFGTGGSERITVEGTKSALAGANANFSISAWIYPTTGNDKWIYSTNQSNNSQAGWHDLYLEGSTKLVWRHSDGSTHRSMMSTNPVSVNEWSYILINRTNNVTYMYINGSLVAQNSDMTNALYTHTNAPSIGIRRFYDNNSTNLDFEGYITDVHVKTAAISSPTTVPTERAVADSDTWLLTAHLPYFADGSSNNYTVGAYNNVFPKPFSPYDYEEYDATDHGGSVYFEGSDDWLQTSTGKIPTSGSFTVSAWAYSTRSSSSTKGAIFGQGIGGQSGRAALFINSDTFEFHCESGDTDSGVTALRNVWYFLELQVTSSTAKLFINGVEEASKSLSSYSAGNYDLFIGDLGAGFNATFDYTGYISDFLVQSGTPSGSSTVPTAPRSSSGASLHIKGTDASIIDKSQGSNLKLVGDTTGSTTTKFTGAKSMYFDGTGDGIVIPHSDNFNLNNCDWTIEYWFNLPNPNAIRNWTFIQKGDNTTVRPYTTTFRIDNSNGVEPRLFVSPNNSSQTGISNNAWQTFNAWHHVAFVRVNSTGVITRYINGTTNGTVTSDLATNTENLEIGTVTSASDEEGYIQDLRISKGKAHYTANFTPPTAPLEG